MTDLHNKAGAPPTHVHVERNRQPGWFKALAWAALIAGLLALLLGLARCDRHEAVAVAPVENQTGAVGDGGAVVATTPGAGSATALAGTSRLGTYLAGNEPAPHSFQFERLNFETARSDVRAADAAEMGQIASVLQRYPNARVRIAGYADARGSSTTNATLGKARADAVKAALVGQGVDASRIETASGGEADPVASNGTASGQAQNRRTELVVTSR